MKKILFVLFVICSVAASAQSTTPRGGVGANNDNTFRALTFKFYSASDASGADSVKLNLNAYNSHIAVSLIDSLVVSFPSVAKCYVGDLVKFTVIGTTSGNKLKFSGSNAVVASSSIAVSSGLRANICFIFDGAKWVELSRNAY